jgi:PAP2 superfamily
MSRAMKIRVSVCCLLLILPLANARAESSAEPDSTSPRRLSLSSVITGLPNSTSDAFAMSFTCESIPVWAGILGSTAVLYHYDEDIYHGGQTLGRRWGLSNRENTRTTVEVGPYNILRLPTDTASALYFLGDGWMHGTIAAGFLASGYLSDNTKAVNTGIEIVHGMVISTVFSQVLKHAFGRESPSQSTEPRGRWRPFPSIKSYNTRTAEYDAMPSGHVMTATLMFTIVRGNYPQYDKYLLPTEVIWLTALGFGMVNNGVHWASDYPLGIAMGYVFGKAALNLANDRTALGSKQEQTSMFFPGYDSQTLTANWLKRF